MIWMQEWNATSAVLLMIFTLGGAVEFLERWEALLRDLENLEYWAIINDMKVNKGRCQVLHLGWSSTEHSYRTLIQTRKWAEGDQPGSEGMMVRAVQHEQPREQTIFWGLLNTAQSAVQKKVVVPLYLALVQSHPWCSSGLHTVKRNLRPLKVPRKG